MSKTVPIERYFEQIEGAIEALEDGELPLEEALQRYEAGLKSVRQARGLLDRFEARIAELQDSLQLTELTEDPAEDAGD
jgi:exodeoxyribonuclease VII small subunit